MSEYFEIVVYTAALQEYADWILDGVDQSGCISHRLYRQHCVRDSEVTKDLRFIGRELTKTVIVDNLKENYEGSCPSNGIEIKGWYNNDDEDSELLDLMPFLKSMVEQ